MCTKLAIPYLKQSENPHVLTLSPPLDIFTQGVNWFAPHAAYTLAKYGMTMAAYGHAEEFKGDGIAFNTLWPRTAIATSAVKNLLGGDETMKMSRKPEILADAAWHIITSDSKQTTGGFYMDDEILVSTGQRSLDHYACIEGTKEDEFAPDFFC